MAQTGQEGIAAQIAADLAQACRDGDRPAVLDNEPVWPSDRPGDWRDVLLVVFASRTLAVSQREYLDAYLRAHVNRDPQTRESCPYGLVLPVAVDARCTRPPEPISDLVSILFSDGQGVDGAISRAVGCYLGLKLNPAEKRIFISYRRSDGEEIARDLCRRLGQLRLQPWLDAAEEEAERVTPGMDLQRTIRKNLRSASLVLFVDTPGALDSEWIRYEVDVAIGELLLTLPIVVGAEYSRFDALLQLRRTAPVKPAGPDGGGISDEEWDAVRREIEELLLSSYRRRLQLIHRASRIFESEQFSWKVLDAPKRMFDCRRPQPPLPELKVLTHCSIHDPRYRPVLEACLKYADGLTGPRYNHQLCVYDHEQILNRSELEHLGLDQLRIVPVHHNELHFLIGSNFTALPL